MGYRQYIAVIIWVVENISQLLRTDNQDEWSPVLLDKNMETIQLMISGHFIRNTVHPSIYQSIHANMYTSFDLFIQTPPIFENFI